MLTEIRNRSSGWFAWAIAAFIIVPMAFWGINEYATTEANPTLAEIGEIKITDAEFRARLSSEQQRFREQIGEDADDSFLSSDTFKQGVLDRMVTRAVVQKLAAEENYRIGNEQLATEIKNSDLFQIDGRFNQDAYERYLIGTQYSKTRYEDTLRQDLLLGQVVAGYDESALVLPDEVRALLEAQAERRSIEVVTLRKQNFAESVSVSDPEIEEFYQANPASFMQPRRVSIDYLEINADDLAQDIDIDEQELRDLYEQKKSSYLSKIEREIRHILLATNGSQDDTAQLTKARRLLAELRAGADFAALAAEHSDDPGSAQNGGSLGLVEAGQMVPEFEEAAFALQAGEISEPVKSPFGYHLIEVTNEQQPQQKSFDEVRLEILQSQRQALAEERLIEQVSQLRDLAFEQPDNLDAAADQLGLVLRTSELFTESQGQGIAANPLVRSSAFSDEVLIDELNSEPIEISPTQTVVLRKKQLVEAAPSPLAEVRDQIITLLQNQKAAELAEQRAEQLFATAKTDWSVLADDEQLEQGSYTVSLIEPNASVSPAVIQKAVSMQLGDGGAVIDKVFDRNGDVHLVRLLSVTPGNLDTVPEQVKQATRQVIAQRNGSALLSAYIEQLKDQHAPEISAKVL